MSGMNDIATRKKGREMNSIYEKTELTQDEQVFLICLPPTDPPPWPAQEWERHSTEFCRGMHESCRKDRLPWCPVCGFRFNAA